MTVPGIWLRSEEEPNALSRRREASEAEGRPSSAADAPLGLALRRINPVSSETHKALEGAAAAKAPATETNTKRPKIHAALSEADET